MVVFNFRKLKLLNKKLIFYYYVNHNFKFVFHIPFVVILAITTLNYKIIYVFHLLCLEMFNLNLGSKLEDKEKIIKFLKDEIEELSQPKSCSDFKMDDHSLTIKKLNQDILDLEFNNNELKQQLGELENQRKNLHDKVIKFKTLINIVIYLSNVSTVHL